MIPVRDRATGLAATLAALGPTSRGDRGRRRVGTAGRRARRAASSATTRPGGPAAARNTGWRAAHGAVIAFVDADCEPAPGVAGHPPSPFRRPGRRGGRAPDHQRRGARHPRPAGRLRAAALLARPGRRARRRSGRAARCPTSRPRPWPSAVRPSSTSAASTRPCASARTSIWCGGSEKGMAGPLRAGRVVTHPARADFAGWLRQRYHYGRSAAPLAARHGRAVAPVAISPWSAAAWALAAGGRPVAGGRGWPPATSVALARRAGRDRSTARTLARWPSPATCGPAARWPGRPAGVAAARRCRRRPVVATGPDGTGRGPRSRPDSPAAGRVGSDRDRTGWAR